MGDKYHFQTLVVEDANRFLNAAKPGDRRLYASPTGTGKSYMELRLQSLRPEAWIVTPRVEIGYGMLEKLGVDPSLEALYARRICTPIVLRNRLLAGEWRAPKELIIDEAHHHTAETYQLLDLLTGLAPAVGFTATPYRGSPKATQEFRRQWGDPQWAVTYPEAVNSQVLSMPACRIVPLVDDDLVTVSNGQFTVESLEDATVNRLGDACRLVGSLDRPTIVSLPSRALAKEYARLAGYPCSVVIGETSREDRRQAFEDCVACRSVLVQVQVVSEGVDLPVRRLIDLHPMLSPVEFLQQFGRITRPADVTPEYIGCNRNLLRHAYLLEGCLPPAIIAAGDKAFGGPSKRLAGRALGLETLGRFAGAEIPFADGTTGACYSVSTCEGSQTRQYVCLVHPLRAEPLWAMRLNQRTDDPMKPHYGRWQRCDPPQDLTGFASVPPSAITDKMRAWWTRDAGRRGLDPSAKVTRKNFQALPVLTDLKTSL